MLDVAHFLLILYVMTYSKSGIGSPFVEFDAYTGVRSILNLIHAVAQYFLHSADRGKLLPSNSV
jgi:hypothetical protein